MITLDVKYLTKIYPHPLNSKLNLPILSNLYFKCNSEKLNFIIGPSGSGKTTIFNILSGLTNIESGEIVFNDQIVNVLDSASNGKYLKRIKYLNQVSRLNLDFNISLVDNLKYALLINKPDKKGLNLENSIHKIIKLCNLINIYENPLTTYSGGEIQRAAIAKCIITSPSIFLLDEPTSNLDSRSSLNIITLLRLLLKNSEILIIIATHDLNLIDYNSDNIIDISRNTFDFNKSS